MTTVHAISMARAYSAKRSRWQWTAVAGVAIALGGIMLGATGFAESIPLPTWGFAAVPLVGFGITGIAGLRLMTMRVPTQTVSMGAVASRGLSSSRTYRIADSQAGRRVKGSSTSKDSSHRTGWAAMAQALETVRSGQTPLVNVPARAGAEERVAFEKANEAFQFLARRQKVIRAALDELRGELNNYHRYLTKSQVGLIGANSVAERLEQFDERLAKIRSAM